MLSPVSGHRTVATDEATHQRADVGFSSLFRNFFVGTATTLQERSATVQPTGLFSRITHLFRSLWTNDDPQLPDELDAIPHSTDPFKNWGTTVHNTPLYTFYPETRADIAAIVLWAKERGLKVRCSGHRHSWSSMYADNGQIQISLLPKFVSELIPALHPPRDPSKDMQTIEVESISSDGKSASIRVGTSVTNRQLREWFIFDREHGGKWTLPLNVIMEEISMGGNHAMICHGAGIHNGTISDLVREVEFINANGQLQRITDRELLKTAAGSLGALGVVTSVVLECDQMTYAKLSPKKRSLGLAVPPPGHSLHDRLRSVPAQSLASVTQHDEKTLRQAEREFKDLCEKSYYSEFFWFPGSKDVWVNCWHNDGQKEDAIDSPSPLESKLMAMGEYLAQQCNKSELFRIVRPAESTRVRSEFIMNAMPSGRSAQKTVFLPDALHFQRGIHNMKVRNCEVEIPIPRQTDGSFDWAFVQTAWWHAINLYYATSKKSPMNLALEMRMMGGSNVTLAPQRGNEATLSIEILSVFDGTISESDWTNIKQMFLDTMCALRDREGNLLNVRPHWAKEWQGLNYRGTPIVDAMKKVYKRPLEEFRSDLTTIAEEGGYTLDDMKSRFSNDLIDRLIYS